MKTLTLHTLFNSTAQHSTAQHSTAQLSLRFILSLLLFTLGISSPVQAQPDWECATTEETPQNFQSGPGNLSEYGQAFTPRGTINALVVYVAYKNTLSNPITEWDIPPEIQQNPSPEIISTIDKRGLPNFFENDGHNPHEFMFDDAADFDDMSLISNPDFQKSNVSYKFNLMSHPNQDFRLVGKPFEMKTGEGAYEPVLIVIDPSEHSNILTYKALHEIVLQKMAALNPDASWYEQFDQRQNSPNFGFDNSMVNSDGSQAGPDGQIDMIIFSHRYTSSGTQPFDNMKGWMGSGGGFSSSSIASGSTSLPGGKHCNQGFMYVGGGVPTQIFIHEMCHSIFDASHTYNANSVTGSYFTAQISGMAGCAGINAAGNALHPFERWYLGYITPHDVSTDQTITIGDINATGDAIRVEIPYTNQRLWIYGVLKDWVNSENQYYNRDIGPGSYLLTNVPPGIHLSIESASNDKSVVHKFYEWANCFYDLNAAGNYGRRWNPTGPVINDNWGHQLLAIDHNEAEAIGGINFTHIVREDSNGDNQINYSPDPNALPPYANESVYFQSEKNGSDYQAYWRIFNSGNYPSWSRENVFLTGDEINIGTNPAITSYPKFNIYPPKILPTILSGIRIKISNIDLTMDQATVAVSFKYTTIENDVTWTANIELPNITQDDEPDLILAAGKTLTMNLSKAVNTTVKNSITNDFINPAVLRLKSGTKTILEINSELLVKNHSTLIIESGAEIIVKSGAKLTIEPTANVIYEGGQINLESEDSKLIIKGKLTTKDGVNFSPIGAGITEIYSTHQLALGANSHVIFSRPEGTQIAPMFDLLDGTDLIIQNRNITISNCKGMIHTNAQINVINGAVNIENAEIEGTGSNNIGIENTASTGFTADHVLLKNLNQGFIIKGALLVSLDNLNTYNCPNAVEIEDVKDIYIDEGDYFGSTNYTFHIKEAGKVISTDALITNNGGSGYWVESTPFVFINGGEVMYASTGIKNKQSNLFIRECAKIHFNNVGIDYIDNSTEDYSLTVGDHFGAKVADNAVANIRGKNIILNIDANTHQYNLPFPYNKIGSPNNFSNSPLIFDICYDNNIGTIPMRGNYWGTGGGLTSQTYSLKKLSGCTANAFFNDDNYASTYSCTYPIDPDSPDEPHVPDSVICPKCELIVGVDTIRVHEQNKLAAQDINSDDIDEAQIKYQPIADMEEQDSTGYCEMMQKFARTMDLANETLSTRSNSTWDPSVIKYGKRPEYNTEDAEKINVYFDGNTIQISSDIALNSVQITDIAGQVVYHTIGINAKEILIPFRHYPSSIYIISCVDIQGNTQTKKITNK